jgi:hypothetical protein
MHIRRVTVSGRRQAKQLLASSASAALVLLSCTARAQDPFEIQVYDSETAGPRKIGLELHANYVARGTTSGPDLLLPTDRIFHLTFEPHLGIGEWAELGGYLQTVVLPSGGYHYAGTKLRFKARLPQPFAHKIGLALNAEISVIPRAYSEARFGSELRPIVDLRIGQAYFALNPIIDVDLDGKLAGRPQLEPAAKAELMLLDDHLGLGPEYYWALGPITAPDRLSEQTHRFFATADLMQMPAGPLRFAVNLGVGYGLAAGEKWIVKSIVGVETP